MAGNPDVGRPRSRATTRGRDTPNTSRSVQTGAEGQPHEATVIASEMEPAAIHRERAIAELAYLAAEKRGFVPGYELDDWLAAEKEIDALLALAGRAASSGKSRE